MVIIMKSIYTILVASLVLSGCIYIPGNNPNSPSAKLFDYKPSKDFTRTQSMGPLSCEAGQICPEFTVDWKEQSNNLYTVKADIFHANNYDIQKLNFEVSNDELQKSNPWFDKKFRILQTKLFISALKVRKQFLYENKKSVKSAQIIWKNREVLLTIDLGQVGTHFVELDELILTIYDMIGVCY